MRAAAALLALALGLNALAFGGGILGPATAEGRGAALLPLHGPAPSGVGGGPTWTADPQYAGALAPSPTGLFYPGLAGDPSNGEVLLFGGCTGVLCSNPSNATWVFDGGIWTQLHPALSPPGREEANLVWDASDGYFLLYGGDGARGDLNDTWSFADGVWTNLTTPSNPGHRANAMMAYDSSLGEVVLVGGYGCLGSCGTWAYSAGVWTEVVATEGPSGWTDGMLADDPGDQTLVEYGGVDLTGTTRASTWEFNGTGWAEINGTAPPLREDGMFAWDPAVGAAILFGGDYVTLSNFPGVTYNDTWAFSDNRWTEYYPGRAPPVLGEGGLAYDSANGGELVEVGGCGPTACPNSVTYEYGDAETVSVATTPTDCGSVVIGTVPVANGQTLATPPGTFALNATGCSSEYWAGAPNGTGSSASAFTFTGGVALGASPAGSFNLTVNVTASGGISLTLSQTPSVVVGASAGPCDNVTIQIAGSGAVAGATVDLLPGVYPISAPLCAGHAFLDWSVTGGLSVANGTDRNASLRVITAGTLTPNYQAPAGSSAVGSGELIELVAIGVVVVVVAAVAVLLVRRRRGATTPAGPAEEEAPAAPTEEPLYGQPGGPGGGPPPG